MRFAVVFLPVVALLAGCANAGRELKAPCGPISSYADDAGDACGPEKPVNPAFTSLLETE